MKFIADDGKIFDTMEECEEYEKILNEGSVIAQLWMDNVTLYDNEGNVSNPLFDNDIAAYLNSIADALNGDESSFIAIHATGAEWSRIRDYFKDEFGHILPGCPGLWRYDWDTHQWINYYVELYNFLKNWEAIKPQIAM